MKLWWTLSTSSINVLLSPKRSEGHQWCGVVDFLLVMEPMSLSAVVEQNPTLFKMTKHQNHRRRVTQKEIKPSRPYIDYSQNTCWFALVSRRSCTAGIHQHQTFFAHVNTRLEYLCEWFQSFLKLRVSICNKKFPERTKTILQDYSRLFKLSKGGDSLQMLNEKRC